MKRIYAILGFFLIVSWMISSAVSAQMTDEEIARLGKDLTPLGGEMAGNADGSIPAYEGGITTPPADYVPGGYRVDPFADDKVLFTITAANMDQYADKLTEMHKMMLKTYPNFKMQVYPTRRSASYPQRIYDATKKYSKNAESDGIGGVLNVVQGIAIPIPKNADEVLANYLTRYRGESTEKKYLTAVVNESGSYTPQITMERFYNVFHLPESTLDNVGKYTLLYKLYKHSPARIAGQIVLLHEPISYTIADRSAWTYNPGQRRVRRAPNYEHDNPGTGSDGVITVDQKNQWSGTTERFDWTLIGKKEMYVPYNAYGITTNKVKLKELLTPQHMNPEFLRYELHRVWIYEANLKEDSKHLYKKRRFYADEDSWHILVQDIYDNEDKFWRGMESFCINYYDVPTFMLSAEIGYDFLSKRYFAVGLVNETEPMKFNLEQTPKDFTPSAIRREATR